MNYQSIVRKLAQNELKLWELPSQLSSEDIEDLEGLTEDNSIQDVEIVIIDICERHQAIQTITRLQKEKEDEPQKELIRCLESNYRNKRHIKTVAECSSNKQLLKILEEDGII